MALTINDILARNLFPGLELRAGAECGSNIVSWVNIMEILDATDSVKAGELLITTGYGLEDSGLYSTLVRRLKDRGTAGIMIQPGYYIDQIPSYILQDADRLGLPVLCIPPSYAFSDLLHTLISEIASESGSLPVNGFDAPRFLKSLTDRLTAENGMAFTKKSTGCLVCITPAPGSALNPAKSVEAVRRVSAALTGRSPRSVSEIRSGGQACLFFLSEDPRALNSLRYDLISLITQASETSGINLYAGSELVSSPEGIPQAMQRALQCVSLLRQIGARRGFCSYENYGFISNLGIIYRNCRGHLPQYQSLQALIARDRTKQTDYIDTLRVFLTENCNTSKAAERLFIHRHTLLNRLQSIREICGIDLKNYCSRLGIAGALQMYDYFGT